MSGGDEDENSKTRKRIEKKKMCKTSKQRELSFNHNFLIISTFLCSKIVNRPMENVSKLNTLEILTT